MNPTTITKYQCPLPRPGAICLPVRVAQLACPTVLSEPVPTCKAGYHRVPSVGLPDSVLSNQPAVPKNRVSPNTIRAERSEQEVAAATYSPESNFPYPFNTARQAGHGTRKPLSYLQCLLQMSYKIRRAYATDQLAPQSWC